MRLFAESSGKIPEWPSRSPSRLTKRISSTRSSSGESESARAASVSAAAWNCGSGVAWNGSGWMRLISFIRKRTSVAALELAGAARWTEPPATTSATATIARRLKRILPTLALLKKL